MSISALQAGADGVPVYWASPGGGPAVGFRLAESDADQRDLRESDA